MARVYHVRVSVAAMPSGVKAPYQHVAVMRSEVGPTDTPPAAIRNTARWTIVAIWARRHLGWRPRGNTAAEVAQRAAWGLADLLESAVTP